MISISSGINLNQWKLHLDENIKALVFFFSLFHSWSSLVIAISYVAGAHIKIYEEVSTIMKDEIMRKNKNDSPTSMTLSVEKHRKQERCRNLRRRIWN